MPLTPETLPRHELVGLSVRVVDATDPGLVGTAGTVIRETERTLVVRTAGRSSDEFDGRGDSDSGVADRQVPKRGTTFEFRIPCDDTDTDEAAGEREPSGTAVELPPETAGRDAAGQSDGCETAAYVTVDGDVLLARPARRTEQEVDSTWH